MCEWCYQIQQPNGWSGFVPGGWTAMHLVSVEVHPDATLERRKIDSDLQA